MRYIFVLDFVATSDTKTVQSTGLDNVTCNAVDGSMEDLNIIPVKNYSFPIITNN